MISQWRHAYLIISITFSNISVFGQSPLYSAHDSESGSEILATVISSEAENTILPDVLPLPVAASSPERDESLQLIKRSIPLSLSFGPILFPAQLTPPLLSESACLANSNSVVESIAEIIPYPRQVPFNTENEELPVILPELAVALSSERDVLHLSTQNNPLSLSFGPILFPAQLTPPLLSELACHTEPIIVAQNYPFTHKVPVNSVNRELPDILPLLATISAPEQEESRQSLTHANPLSLSFGPIQFPAQLTPPFLSQTACLSTELPISTPQVFNNFGYPGFPAISLRYCY